MSRAARMDAAVAFIQANPGATMRMVIVHLLAFAPLSLRLGNVETPSSDHLASRQEKSAYRQAASVVDRIVRDRLVRQSADLRLYPWDSKRKAFADALERALYAAPDDAHQREVLSLAARAWREAGDENRARTLELLAAGHRPLNQLS